jgi:hypothetical protein
MMYRYSRHSYSLYSIKTRFEKNNISIIWQRDHRSIMFEKNTDMNVYMEFEGKKYQNRTWNKISKLCTLAPFWHFISWKRHEPKNYTSKLNTENCVKNIKQKTLFSNHNWCFGDLFKIWVLFKMKFSN